MLLTALLWGGNFAAIKLLLRDLQPLDAVFIRGTGAAIFFALAVLATRHPRLRMPREDWIRLVAIGIIGVTILNLAVLFGQSMLPASLASLIVTSNPVFTALISRLALGEPLTSRKIAGIALAFVGLVIVLRWGGVGSEGFGLGRLQGVLILMIAPFSWAIYTVLSKPLLARHSSVHIAAYSTIIGALGFLPIPLVRSGTIARIQAMSLTGWEAALFATLISFVFAYILWYRGLRVLTASQAAVYIYLVPVFGLLSAWLVLGEQPTIFLLLGGAVILAGVILTNSGGRPRPDTVPVATRPEMRAGERSSP
ncbi:MAG TPA: DMT family transporter [Thermomicrobiales bacterium]|nr:DMT family transporter [Thermomicrobiales bacterium]